MEGYVKLHRAILHWEWYKDLNTKSLFIHFLLKACFDNCNHKGLSLGKGQVVTSVKKLSEDLGLTVRQIRTSLEKLQRSGEITVQTNNKHTVITVVKYEDYQIAYEVEDIKVTSKVEVFSTKDKKPISIAWSDQCKNDQLWLESICMKYSTYPESVISALKTFDLHLKTIGENKTTLRDYKGHFNNWLRYNMSEIKPRGNDYRWKWKGQPVKTGTYNEMLIDKQNFDSPGFEFTIIEGKKLT